MTDNLTKEQVISVLEFAQGLYDDPIVGKYGFYTPQMLNEELVALNNTASKPTYDKVNKALDTPIESAEILQTYSTWAKFSDAIYAKTQNYFSNMLSFDIRRVCINAKKSDYNSKEYKEDLERVYKFFRTFDHKREFKKMVNEMLKKNVVYTWYRDNRNEDTPQKALQILPQNYCKITGNTSLCPLFDFDMGYFLNTGTNIDMFDPIFKKYYNDMFNGDLNKYSLRNNPMYQKGGSYAYWQHTSPINGAWVFVFTDGNYNEIPPFSFLLRSSILNPEIEALQRDKDIISAYGLLYGEMETSNKALSGQVPNDTAFTPKAMGKFLQLIASGLDKHLKPLAFPLKDVEFKQFSDSNTDMSDNQYTSSAAQGASASSLIYTTEKMGVEEFKNALFTDYLLMKQLYRQFDAFLNYFVNQKTRKFKFRFTCDGSDYPSIRDEMTTRVKSLADRGIVGNISLWEQAFGYGLGELDTMCDEGISQDKLQLMLNPNTATEENDSNNKSSSNGRPTKTSSEMTESSQISQDINGEQKSEVK